jgi:DNA primase
MATLRERVDAVKMRYDLRDVWPFYTERARKSSNYVLDCCPVHGDKSPSCAIYRDGAYCYGCGESIDVIAAWQLKGDLSFMEALRELEGHEVAPTETVRFIGCWSEDVEPLPDMDEGVLEEFPLLGAGVLHGIGEDVVGVFDLRMIELSGGRKHIVVPVRINGVLRNIKVYRPGESPKWMPLTRGRGKCLYGLDQHHGDTVFLVESEKDVWYAFMVGVPAIATGGATSFTLEMRRQLDHIEKVYVLGDMDEAGRRFNARVQSEMRRAIPVWWQRAGCFMRHEKRGYDLADFVRQSGDMDLLMEIARESERLGGYFLDWDIGVDDL